MSNNCCNCSRQLQPEKHMHSNSIFVLVVISNLPVSARDMHDAYLLYWAVIQIPKTNWLKGLGGTESQNFILVQFIHIFCILGRKIWPKYGNCTKFRHCLTPRYGLQKEPINMIGKCWCSAYCNILSTSPYNTWQQNVHTFIPLTLAPFLNGKFYRCWISSSLPTTGST